MFSNKKDYTDLVFKLKFPKLLLYASQLQYQANFMPHKLCVTYFDSTVSTVSSLRYFMTVFATVCWHFGSPVFDDITTNCRWKWNTDRCPPWTWALGLVADKWGQRIVSHSTNYRSSDRCWLRSNRPIWPHYWLNKHLLMFNCNVLTLVSRPYGGLTVYYIRMLYTVYNIQYVHGYIVDWTMPARSQNASLW